MGLKKLNKKRTVPELLPNTSLSTPRRTSVDRSKYTLFFFNAAQCLVSGQTARKYLRVGSFFFVFCNSEKRGFRR